MLFHNSIIFLFFLVVFLVVKKHIKPGVYINGILCSNNCDIIDPIFHKQVDCIELFHGIDYTDDISGYYLTNKYNKFSKLVTSIVLCLPLFYYLGKGYKREKNLFREKFPSR